MAGVRATRRERLRRVGRPSVDPHLLRHLLLVAYLYGITSGRRLVEEVRIKVAYG